MYPRSPHAHAGRTFSDPSPPLPGASHSRLHTSQPCFTTGRGPRPPRCPGGRLGPTYNTSVLIWCASGSHPFSQTSSDLCTDILGTGVCQISDARINEWQLVKRFWVQVSLSFWISEWLQFIPSHLDLNSESKWVPVIWKRAVTFTGQLADR